MRAEPAEADKPEHLETNVLLLGDTLSLETCTDASALVLWVRALFGVDAAGPAVR